ncbi:MAG: phosphatidylserine decarboxylase family protein [Deltaproteobacteria bacterium]|nr:MAG: phosphatidylserine decarboxylase family protein [Deltaproteobacteria bacterium]
MRRLLIAKEGLPYTIGLAVLAALFAFLGLQFLTGLTLIATLLVINFFRDPNRVIPNVPHAVLAPADGRIVFAGPAFEDRFLNRETLKVSIFMSIFNVHVNRIPFSGEVESVHYEKGKFLSANLDQASWSNEQNVVHLHVPGGGEILFVQIAGLVARRIVCSLKPGDHVRRGDRFGMIRFGSRLDLHVPTDSHLAVKKGQRVKAGESIVCYYPRNKEDEEDKKRDR